MWVKTDLLKEHNIEVPKLGINSMKLLKIERSWSLWFVHLGSGTNDLMATSFLNFYVRSGEEALNKKILKQTTSQSLKMVLNTGLNV